MALRDLSKVKDLSKQSLISAGKGLRATSAPEEVQADTTPPGGNDTEAGPPPASPERAEQDVSPAATPAAEPSEPAPAESPAPAQEAEPTRGPSAALERMGKRNEELRAQNKQLEEQGRQMRARLDALERADRISKAAQQERPQGYEEWSPDQQSAYMADQVVGGDVEALRQEVAALRAENLQREVTDRLRELPAAQREAVMGVWEEYDGRLSVDDAMLIAPGRFPDVFQNGAPVTPEVPVSHTVQQPAPVGERKPTRDPEQDLDDAIAAPGTQAQKLQALAARVKHGLRQQGHRLFKQS